jgi:hypothetical protein
MMIIDELGEGLRVSLIPDVQGCEQSNLRAVVLGQASAILEIPRLMPSARMAVSNKM